MTKLVKNGSTIFAVKMVTDSQIGSFEICEKYN